MYYELERISHDKSFPIKSMVVSIDYSCPHWHYDYEAILMLRGSLQLHVGAQTYFLKSGDIALVNTSEIHSLMSSNQKNLCLILQFDPKIIHDEYSKDRDFLFRLNTSVNAAPNASVISHMQQTLAKIGYSSRNKSDGYQFLIKSYMYRFISDLFCYTKYDIKAQTVENGKGEPLSVFDAVNEYIKSNFSTEFSVADLCRALGLSKSSLYRSLRDTAMTTYKDLLDFYRIEHSKNLLKTTDYTISYIALLSGFSSDTTFYRSFKKLVGVSPKSFRDSHPENKISGGVQGYRIFDDYEADQMLKLYMNI